MTKTNIIELLTNEGLKTTDKKSYLLVTDDTNNKVTVHIKEKNIVVTDKFGNSDIVVKNDLKGLVFAVFSALECEYNYTTNYVNEYLLNCETKQDDFLVSVRHHMEDVEIIDVIGVIEEKGRVYVGLEVKYDEYCYLVNVNFMNVWDFVYKDEMIEIQELLSRLVSEQLKIDLGINNNILEDIKSWLEDKAQTNEEEKELLNDIINYGVENVAPSHLIYNSDIQDYYTEHQEEINSIVEEETGYTIDDAIEDLDAFEIMINSVGGIDSELEFEDSHELENSELRWFVWLAFEHVVYEYLTTLEK